MFFELTEIKYATSYVQKRAHNMGINFSIDDIRTLGIMATQINENRIINGKGAYTQGAEIDPEDQKNIRDTVQSFVEKEKEKLLANANKPDSPLKSITNTAEYFATFADFYYVKAMSLLRCPNMPLFMFDKGFRKTIEDSAIAVNGSVTKYHDITTQDAYTRQRYKNAKDIEKDCKSIFDNIDHKLYTPKNVATLLSEYQALKIRQSNHGIIWRLFHRSENNARTEMLNKMETHIKKALPAPFKDINIDKATPQYLGQEIAEYVIKRNVDNAITDRFENKTETIYGCQAINEFKIEQHKENGKMPLIDETDIINDVSIESVNDIGQSEPVISNNQNNIILMG